MKKKEALEQIGSMKGIVKLQDILNIIHKIDNFKTDTLDKLSKAEGYGDEDTIALSDIYVDLSYQRKLKIQTIINRLVNSEPTGFDKALAGHIDLSVRPDGRMFCWDGFHRCIKAGISGLTTIKASLYHHAKGMVDSACRIDEAKKFKGRNADMTKMAPDEIYRAKVVFQDPEALEQLTLLKRCKLNVGGTNDDVDAYDLPGYAAFNTYWTKQETDDRFYVEAAEIIRSAYPNLGSMSVYLLLGFTSLLSKNEDEALINTASITEIREKFMEMTTDVHGNVGSVLQKSFSQNVLKHQTIPSVGRNLLKKGLKDLYNDDGQEVIQLIKALGIEDEDDFDDEL